MYKTREDTEKEITGGDIFWKVIVKHLTPQTIGFIESDINKRRLSDLAAVREWAESNKVDTPRTAESVSDLFSMGQNRIINDLISFITSCEAKLK